MNIKVDPKLKAMTPNFNIGVLKAHVKVFESKNLNDLISEYENEIRKNYKIEDIINLEIIKDGRNAYKKYGKDPSRYRLAVESLYRRITKGNNLYRINNVVDAGNIISIETKKSVAVLDYDKIAGDIFIRLGRTADEYEGIGRGKLNIVNIPIYEDKIGPFGSTTSDTSRTMITESTNTILVFIISFSGRKNLEKNLDFTSEIYKKFCDAVIVERYII
jgi:DNA/RNA-binding domain of Phe-tRNA-synthetase-like protein